MLCNAQVMALSLTEHGRHEQEEGGKRRRAGQANALYSECIPATASKASKNEARTKGVMSVYF